ncbi:MAG: alpha/beta hydrolase [Chloroflexota bacterium]
MDMIHTRTGNVAYESYGQGLPLILLHANPGDHRDYEAVIPALAQNYQVIAVDWPGYGESPAPQPPGSASAMLFAAVLEDVMNGLGLDRVALIGNSVGGYAAARFAITHPSQVEALVLVSSGGFTAHSMVSRIFSRLKGTEFLTRLIATRFAQAYLKKRNRYTTDILARTDAGRHNPASVAVDAAVWRSFINPDHDLRARAQAIIAPTLVLSGKYDPVIKPDADGKTTADSIPGARQVIMETGHEPFAEDSDAFLKVVVPFLQEVTEQYVPSHV